MKMCWHYCRVLHARACPERFESVEFLFVNNYVTCLPASRAGAIERSMEETRKETLMRIGLLVVNKMLEVGAPFVLYDKQTVVFDVKSNFTLSVEDLKELLEAYCDDDIDISYDAARVLNATVLMTQL